MGMVAARNSTHYGIAGYYALMAAEQGMIGITGTNARPSIAPTFGVENMLGTNPLTFGMPTDEAFPFMHDCATSITQRGKIEVVRPGGQRAAAGAGSSSGRASPRPTLTQILNDLVTGQAALTPLGGIGEETRRLQGLRLRHGGGDPLRRAAAGRLPEGSSRAWRTGAAQAVPPRAFLHGHRRRGLHRPRRASRRQRGDILRELRRAQKAPGQERILHCRREGVPGVAGAQGKRDSARRHAPAPVRRDARRTGPDTVPISLRLIGG